MPLKLGRHRNCPEGVYQIHFQCSMVIKFGFMKKMFPNFSILDFVTVTSFLSKHCVPVFLIIKFPKDRKLLLLMKYCI